MPATAARSVSATEDRPLLPFMVLLFVGSGCAALIYEVVWLQLLSLIVGSSAISLGVILGTFMGGMCLGSYLLPKYVNRSEHPLRVYAKLELGIAVFGLLIPLILPHVGGLYTSIGGTGMFGVFVRAIFCAICLLPPTLMMGATLPAIARYVESTPSGVSWLGFFYGGNIFGAVAGCLLAGYYLLRNFDMTTASFVGVALNVAVAFAAFALANKSPYKAPDESAPAAEPVAAPGSRMVLLTIALSGFTALASEVVWARLLGLSLGQTTYTFSLILAVFLFGLGIGSSAGSFIAGSTENPRHALGWCQALLVLGIAWAAYAVLQAMPYWPINPVLNTDFTANFQVDLVKTLFTVLPGAILWGASFPLALAAVSRKGQDPGQLVGTVYAANTVGAIFGSMIASLWLIAAIGTQNGQRLLIAVAAVSALLMLATSVASNGTTKFSVAGALRAAGIAAVALWAGSTVVRVPELLVGYGRFAAPRFNDHGEWIYMGEGMNSSMAVSKLWNGVLNYHNAGKVQASSEPQDMRLQRMLGHLTTLLPKNPERVLVIACGAGVTAGAVSIDPMVKRQTIVEIEPLVPTVVSKYFGNENFHVVDNPKVEVIIDDARHYVLTTDEKFDAITSDPFDPWVKGAATLYTKEFFQLAKDKLNPGGVITVFVQLYESNLAAVKSEVSTFLSVFPNGMVFGNEYQGGGYDVVLVGLKDEGQIDIDAIEERLARPEFAAVRQSLAEIGFYSATDLFSTFAAQGPALAPWMADAQINTDKNLRLQFLAGASLNSYDQGPIYADMIRYRKYPEGLFKGSEERLNRIRAATAGYRP
ncbi:MAG: SAM-dependent methyltransferase [Gemmatimonadetes bacterium]|nr:SAM-dependent methyltransferase [Gemmatimonadota bacterium]